MRHSLRRLLLLLYFAADVCGSFCGTLSKLKLSNDLETDSSVLRELSVAIVRKFIV